MPDRVLNDRAAAAASLDERIALALQAKPEYAIPDGFAAHVASRVPARAVIPAVRPSHYGRWAGVVCAPVLLALIFLFARQAPGGAGTPILKDLLEWTFCAQFAILALWLGGGRLDVVVFRRASD